MRLLLHVPSETATWSLFFPLDGCNNIWASCQGRSYHGNNQTVESLASRLHPCAGGSRAGEAEGTHPVCVWPEPLSSGRAGGAGPLAPCWPSGLAGWLAGLFRSVCPASWCSSHVWSLCLSIPFGLGPASAGCLGPGQTHPGVSIETAGRGCEFLVLENPMWCL